MEGNEKTWSRGTNSRLPFAANVGYKISLLICVVAVFVVLKFLNPLLIAATVLLQK